MRRSLAFLLLVGTSAIAADRTVVVSSGGVLLSPTNLWSANSAAISSALGVLGSGAGDVVGPGSATSGGLALFSGTTGKLLSSSSLTEASLLTKSEAATLYVPVDSPVFTGTITFDGASFGTVIVTTNLFVGDAPYDSGWDGNTNVPTRNAVYDKIQTLLLVPTLTKTANYSLTALDSSTWVNNDGASGAVTNTLPTAVAGRHYGFVILAAQQLVIKASGTDTIRIAGTESAAGGQAATNAVGTTLHLHCPVTGKWVADSQIGTWAVQ